MNKRKQKNRRLRQAGNVLLAFVLALGISAVPVQAAGPSADVSAAEKKEVNLKQAKKITLKNTKGKNKSEVAAIKKLLQKNLDTDECRDVESVLDLNSSVYKWTKDGRLKELCILGLKGKVSLKAFKKLEVFDCGEGLEYNITGLDVSKNSQLKELRCECLRLKNLDVSKCLKLVNLSCGGNQLTRLDVSKCSKLVDLACFDNKLTSLDVSGCPKLEGLSCAGNQFTSLDLSNNPLLSRICVSCDDNVTVTYYSDSAQ